MPRLPLDSILRALAILAVALVAACSRGEGAGDPRAAESARVAGLAAWKTGDFAAAATQFRSASAAFDGDRFAWFALGAAALRTGDGATAREAFEKHLTIIPRDPAAEAGLGLAYAQLNDPGNALLHLTYAADLDDSDVAVKDLERRAETGASIAVNALAAIDRRVERIDPDARAVEVLRLQIRGLNFARDARWSDARAAYEAALRLESDDPTSLLGFGATAMREPQFQANALQPLERFVALEPDNAAGHYCLAATLYLASVLDHKDRIIESLRRAQQLAPNDQDIVYHLARTLSDLENFDPERKDLGSYQLYQRSLELNPYCPSTHSALAAACRKRGESAKAEFHQRERDRLQATATMKRRFPARDPSNPWTRLIELRLERIDRGAAKAPLGDNRLAVTFDATEPALPTARNAAALDLDGDCDLDLVFTAGTAWKNDGKGGFTAADVLPKDLASADASQILVADFDNDDAVDLVFIGDRVVYLRGSASGTFSDATAEVALDGISASAAIGFDYDHEGDVDLLLVVRGAAGATSLRMLRNQLPPRPTRDALPEVHTEFAAAKLSFGDVTADSKFIARDIAALAFGDIENGNDTDVVALGRSAGHLFTNLRGGIFRDISGPGGAARLTGRAVELEDLDSDGWLDLVAIDADGALLHARNRGDGTFLAATALPLLDAQVRAFTCIDFDNDGALDLALSTTDGTRLFRNVAGSFEDATAATEFGVIADEASALVAFDADSDGDDDVLVLHSDRSPHLLRNDGGNTNRRLRLELKGDLSNRLSIGAKVELADGAFFAKREVRRLPLNIGIGPRTRLDDCFVLWTNGVRQPYRDVDLLDTAWMASGDYDRSYPTKEVQAQCGGWLVSQIIRMEGSCPLLYACDGERFHYITDALCSAVLGLDIGGRQRALPNPSDAVRIRGDQLRAKDRRWTLAFTEELRELTYLDWARLVVVDHPTDVEVFTDNKFTFPPFPPFELHRTRAKRPITKAIDHRGNDVTAKLAAIDRQYVDSFRRCEPPMQGMAEMHALELDLGEVAAAKTLRLFLQGWFNWTNSSVNNALAQDGSWQFTPPLLAVADGKGGWLDRGMAGIPAGDNKHIVVDLTGLFPDGVTERRVRLTTNLQIYWDFAFVATDDDPAALPIETHELAPLVADLRYRGYSEQVYPDGKEPNDYAYHSVTTDGSTFGEYYPRFAGKLTRFGDVSPLIDRVDDQFVILHHGDELMLEFDATLLPPPREGYARTFAFRSFGWAKDMDHNTGAATTVEPLPFRGMTAYPPPAGESYPDDAEHRRYRAEWNTRISLPSPMTAAPRPPLPSEANSPHLVFTDVTRGAGIAFHHAEGHDLVMLEDTMGAGAAWGDYDGDGDDDLFLVQGPGPGYEEIYAERYYHKLYRNEGDGTLRDVTAEAGVGGEGRGMAALFADLDDDGDEDLFVTQNGANLLYRNEGNGAFLDVTLDSGIAGTGYHSGIATGDYDKDGDLDLYVGRYVTIDAANRPQEAPGFERGFVRDDPPSVLPMTYPPASNSLWRNDGGLHFTDVTATAGVADEQGRTLGVLFSDFDHDGWLDLFCANDMSLNNFFRNKGDGTFESLAFDVGLDDPRGAMGVALADVDNDTDLDLAVTYWQLEPNGLYRNNVIRAAQKRTRIPTFEEIAARTGFSEGSIGRVGWGVSITDFDSDGRLDAAIVNGYTSPDYETTSLCVPQQPLLLMGAEDGAFSEVTSADYGAFFAGEYNARGLAGSDYDKDGDFDLVVTQNNGDAILLRNDGGNLDNWLQVELTGDAAKATRNAAGARVTVEAGGVKRTRVLLLGSSYLCGETKVLQFGLGEAASYDSITVTWPSGKVTTHPGGAARQRVKLVE